MFEGRLTLEWLVRRRPQRRRCGRAVCGTAAMQCVVVVLWLRSTACHMLRWVCNPSKQMEPPACEWASQGALTKNIMPGGTPREEQRSFAAGLVAEGPDTHMLPDESMLSPH